MIAMQSPPGSSGTAPAATGPVPQPLAPLETVTLYHWLVIFFASAGWLFDCTGQRIFVLSREPALRELLGNAATDAAVKSWGTFATALLMIGWATGGILFGTLSDRYGRVKAMVGTLLAYTVFSGLSGFAHTAGQFLVFRFLFGLGVGGMFGAATTLVAESVPRHFRTLALGSMQAVSACGNMIGSALSLQIVPGMENFWGHYSGWQVLSFVSVVPAVLAVPMLLILREPQPWVKARAEAASGAGRSVGSIPDLFRDARWRRNTLVGICLGLAGMVGLWGIAFYSPELITTAFKNHPLTVADVRNPSQLRAALQSPPNIAVAELKSRLSPAVRKTLNARDGDTFSQPDLQALVESLNHIIQSGNLYNEKAYQGITLKKRTKNLIELARQKKDRSTAATLNRQLVEQLFPGDIQELQSTVDRTKSRGTILQDVGSLFGMFAFTFMATYFNRRTAFLSAFVLCFGSVAYVFYALNTAADVYWMLPVMGFATLSCFAGYSIYFPELFPTRLRGTGVGFCYNTVRYLAAPFPLLLGWLSTLMPFRSVAIAMSSIYLVGITALVWAPETKGKPLPED
jgi:MFS family permease